MLRDEVIQRLQESRDSWKRFGVGALFLFGSVARGERRGYSDVDILVEFARPVGLFEFLELKRVLGEILSRPVDLATPLALRPQIRQKVLSEAIRAA